MQKTIILTTILAVTFLAVAAQGETEPSSSGLSPVLTSSSPEYMRVNRSVTGETDYVASGVFSDLYYWFNVPENWDLSGNNYLFLVLSSSPLLISPDSTITVYLNDVPIQTTLLPGLNSDRDTLKVTIPLDMVWRGFNELRFRFYLRVIDKECRDVDNPAAWATIHKESALHLEYKVPTGKYDLADYPFPFILEGKNQVRSAVFVVPENPTAAEIETASSIISFLISRAQLEKYDYSIYTEKSLPEGYEGEHLVFIGEKTRNSLAKRFPDVKTPKKGEGSVGIFPSPYTNAKAALIVTGGDGEGLLRAAGVLSNEIYSAQLEGKTTTITEKLFEKSSRAGDIRKGTIRLSDIGYGDMKTRGAYRSIISFSFSVPPHIRLLEGSYLNVVFSHSPLVKSDLSTLSIEINNIPVKAVALSEANSERAMLKVPIPNNLLDNDFFKIDARYYLDLGLKDCAHEYVEAAWGVIHEDTFFQLEYEITRNPTLQQFPGLFIDHGGDFDGSIVVPDEVGPGTLKLLSSLAAVVGRHLQGKSGRIKIIKSSDAGAKEKKGNLLFVGSPLDIKLLREAAGKLPVGFDKEGIPEPNEKAPFLKDYASKRALLEVSVSPFAANRFIFVVAGSDDSLKLAAETFADDRLYSALDGDVALVDGTLKSQSYMTFEKKREISLPDIVTGPPLWLIIVIIVVGVLAIAAIIFFVIRLGKKKRR